MVHAIQGIIYIEQIVEPGRCVANSKASAGLLGNKECEMVFRVQQSNSLP